MRHARRWRVKFRVRSRHAPSRCPSLPAVPRLRHGPRVVASKAAAAAVVAKAEPVANLAAAWAGISPSSCAARCVVRAVRRPQRPARRRSRQPPLSTITPSRNPAAFARDLHRLDSNVNTPPGWPGGVFALSPARTALSSVHRRYRPSSRGHPRQPSRRRRNRCDHRFSAAAQVPPCRARHCGDRRWWRRSARSA